MTFQITFVNVEDDAPEEDVWERELPGVPRDGDLVFLRHLNENPRLWRVRRALWYSDLPSQVTVYVRLAAEDDAEAEERAELTDELRRFVEEGR